MTYGGKDDVVHEWELAQVRVFHVKDHYPSYGPIDFRRWTKATDPYQIQYSNYFEPYILIARKLCPYYDERFRGFFGTLI